MPIIPLLVLGYVMLEIAVFIVVGDAIGVLPTLGLVLLSGVVGSILVRVQGLGVFNRIRAESAAGHVPGRELVHGFMILLAGFLLILPGFMTDVLGLLLFIPPVRERVWQFLRSRVNVVSVGGFRRASANRGSVVDLDEEDYRRTDRDRPSGAPQRPQIDHD